MNKTPYAYAVFASLLFFSSIVPHAQAALLASQEDSSGAPSHYWHSDGTNGAFLVLDPNDGGPGYSLGDIATTTSNVVGIHIKAQFDTDGQDATLPNIPRLYDESGNTLYTCAQLPFGGAAYGTAADALALTNPLQDSAFEGKMVDMYFQCNLGVGHDTIAPGTSYRLYFYPVSTADVDDIYVAMNAAGTEPYFEVSGDGTYPPPAPPISISVPEPGTTYFSTDTIIPNATIQNFASYTTVTYTLNGTTIDPTQPLPPLPIGTSTLVIAATDNLGNTIYATSTFQVVSGQAPQVSIATPLNGATYLQNDTLFAAATASSSNAIATTTYTLNGSVIDPTQPLALASLPLGSATLVVSAADVYGKVGYATSTFTVGPADLTPPTVTITNPLQGSTYTDTATVYLTYTATDAAPIVATSTTFNGTNINPAQPLPLLSAPLGSATVSVSATDIYGNVQVSTVTFTIKSPDVTPPTIVITTPAAGHTYLSTATVVPAVSITDASGVATSSYTLDNIPVDPTKALPLSSVPPGSATFSVSATDTFGNSTTTNVVFTISAPPPPDTTPPKIVITSPVSGKLYARSDTVYLTATITDKSAIAHTLYYFDGKTVDPTKPLPFSTAQLGNASVTVVATDAYGNTASSTVNFRIEPSIGQCAADILDAYNHKLIPNKSAFAKIAADCIDLQQYDNDRNNYYNDDNNHGRSCSLDSRYNNANNEVNNTYQDIDNNISH